MIELKSVVGVKAFVSPTIVHFGAVLALAAYVTMPRHTAVSLSLGLGVVGLAGLIYIATTAAAIMLLMIVGIHNAWDIAVWNSVNRHNKTEQ